jgi:hypothetical protein
MPKLSQKPLLRLRNTLDYPLRQLFRWRRSGYALRMQSEKGMFDQYSPAERRDAEQAAGRLQTQYHLVALSRDRSALNVQENLYYLQLLEGALARSGGALPADAVMAADIGPSHWFYVQALYALLKWWNCPSGRSITLEGYEVDAYRVYTDFYSRYDHAQAHMRGLSGVTYIPQGFTRQENRFHLITMLFPFVFERDHLEWGLPTSIFHPDRLLEEAWQSLLPGGILIIVNQGEDEHLAQKQRLQDYKIPVAAAYHQEPLLYHYSIERYVCVCRRDYGNG